MEISMKNIECHFTLAFLKLLFKDTYYKSNFYKKNLSLTIK